MDVACQDMDYQRKGFHTFVMTGDAIIRTNFNPFKPTRQLSYDSQTPQVVKEQSKTERSISNQETGTKENNNDDANEDETTAATALSVQQTCTQNKEFIPGFMVVGEQSEDESKTLATQSATFNAEDSGIDVRLSGELDDSQTVIRSASPETDHPQSVTIDPTDETAGIDEPSAKRLATRLYQLDRFKLSDVCYYLSKSDDFTQRVVSEFMGFFDFAGHPLVDSLRAFLRQISLEGGINKDKETVLMHFTRRYLECNKASELVNTFHSEDSCHTLVCALVLLNTDLHDSSQTGSHKVNRKLFIESLATLNDGVDFPKQLLTSLYTDVKNQPLVAASGEEIQKRLSDALTYGVEPLDSEPTLHDTNNTRWCYSGSESSGSSLLNQSASRSHWGDAEMMKGYLLKKHCKTCNGVKTASGKRGWKRHFAVLKELKLMLLKSDKRSHYHKVDKFIDLDNAYATVASYYTKRKHGFSVTTSDGSEYLFIAGDSETMTEWMDSINLTAASYSKEETPDASTVPHRKSSSYIALLGTLRRMREQLKNYKSQVKDVGNQLMLSQNELPGKGANKQHIRELTERKLLQQRYLQKYTAYVNILTKHLDTFKPRGDSVTESIAEEPSESMGEVEQLYLAGSRLSYRLAVYGALV